MSAIIELIIEGIKCEITNAISSAGYNPDDYDMVFTLGKPFVFKRKDGSPVDQTLANTIIKKLQQPG